MPTDYLFDGSLGWTVPAGVHTVTKAAVWAGGGNGGASADNGDGTFNQGGGGAGSSCVVALGIPSVPGDFWTFEIVDSNSAKLFLDNASSTVIGFDFNANSGSDASSGGEGGGAGGTNNSGSAHHDTLPIGTVSSALYEGQSGVSGVAPDDEGFDIGHTKPQGGHAANSDGDWDAGVLNDGGVGTTVGSELGNWNGRSPQPTAGSPGGGGIGSNQNADGINPPAASTPGGTAMAMIVYDEPVAVTDDEDEELVLLGLL